MLNKKNLKENLDFLAKRLSYLKDVKEAYMRVSNKGVPYVVFETAYGTYSITYFLKSKFFKCFSGYGEHSIQLKFKSVTANTIYQIIKDGKLKEAFSQIDREESPFVTYKYGSIKMHQSPWAEWYNIDDDNCYFVDESDSIKVLRSCNNGKVYLLIALKSNENKWVRVQYKQKGTIC